MLKALIKKQTLELMSFLFKSAKSGRRRSKGSILLYSVLMIYVAVVIGFMFFSLSITLCSPLVSGGLDWLYFSLMALFATAFAVIFSVFATQSQLYEAKDNELLLSMPIKPSMILFSRMLTLYLQSLFFEALILIPALAVYYSVCGFSLYGIILLFVIPLLALSLSCILGWIVAILSSRIRNKSAVTVILSLIFLAAYIWSYSQINKYISMIITNAQQIGQSFKNVFPLYQLGRAFVGDIADFILITAMVLVLFAAVYAVLSKSFIKIATAKHAAAKRRYVRRELDTKSVGSALFRREWRRYLSSPTYIMNCSLGTLFLAGAAVYVLIKGSYVRQTLASIYNFNSQFQSITPLIVAAIICVIATMNTITAPSVSLEGRTLWIIKSLPVNSADILSAKLKLNLFITLPFVLFASASAVAAMRFNLFSSVMIFVIPLFFAVFIALFGLAVNLRFPNFTWSNETVLIKQSMSVTVSIFGSWGIMLLLGVLSYFALLVIQPVFIMSVIAVVLVITDIMLWRWLMQKGAKMFDKL